MISIAVKPKSYLALTQVLFQERVQFVVHRSKAVDTFANTLTDNIGLAKGKSASEWIFEFIKLGGYCY